MKAFAALLALAPLLGQAQDLRRATHSNQITIHHDPVTDVWDHSTGELRPHAKAVVESPLRSTAHSSDTTRRRGLVNDLLSGLKWKDEDEWGIAIAKLENHHQDNEWLAEIGFGTPEQDLKIVLDTGSAGGWIYSPECCYASNHSYFDPSKSWTFANRTVVNGTPVRANDSTTPGTPWNSTYGGAGNGVAGYLVYDSVEIAQGAITVDNVTTALVTKLTGNPNSRINRKMEGLIGLMPARVIDTDIPGGNWTSPLEEAIRQKQIGKPYLSATYVKANRRTGKGGGGRYTFGDVDHSALHGDLNWVNVSSVTYWGLSFDSVKYGANDTIQDPKDSYQRAIIDTGTALVLLTPAVADGINSRIHGSYKRPNTTTSPWLIPCRTGLPEYELLLPSSNKTQPLTITINNQLYTIPISDFPFWPLEPVQNNLCLSAFQPTTTAFSIIGDVFIKNQAITFDFGSNSDSGFTTGRRIGFGQRRDLIGS
ncbi:unnamed protein product [Sympodiomycopsis kandeliae]